MKWCSAEPQREKGRSTDHDQVVLVAAERELFAQCQKQAVHRRCGVYAGVPRHLVLRCYTSRSIFLPLWQVVRRAPYVAGVTEERPKSEEVYEGPRLPAERAWLMFGYQRMIELARRRLPMTITHGMMPLHRKTGA